MMPKSMETLGQAGKFSSMNCFSWTVPYTSLPGASLEVSSGSMMAFWTIALVIIAVMELNALGMLPWKTEANKGLNQMYDGPGVRNPLIAAFGLWIVFLILSEVLLKA